MSNCELGTIKFGVLPASADRLGAVRPDNSTITVDEDGVITAVGGTGVVGLRIWESDWFSITPTSYFDFVHNLNLSKPWLCQPRIIAKVKSGQNGWSAGEYVFTDGSNHNGSTAASELGWAISITANGVHVSFGNSKAFIYNHRSGGIAILDKTNVECKLVISY